MSGNLLKTRLTGDGRENISSIIQPNAVLIDWDNTIIHHNNDTMEIFAREVGINHLDIINLSKDGLTFIEILKEIFDCEKKAKEAKNLYRTLHNKIGRNPEIISGAVEFFKLLKSDNKIICIVSNRERESLKREVRELGLDEYFDAVVGVGDSPGYSKPSPVPIFMALNGIKSPNIETGKYDKDVWMIGDTMADVRAASNAGCLPILFTSENALSADKSKIPYILADDYLYLLEFYRKSRDK